MSCFEISTVTLSPRSPSIVSRPCSLGATVLTGVISFAPMAVGELLAKFPRERTWLLPALQAVQRAERYLSPEALEAVATHLRVPKSEVWGVASHYPELRLAPPGTRVVRVCTGVSCKLRGGSELLAACERRLGLRAGQTTADGAVTLEAMDCAFACAVAPVVEIDHAGQGRVTPRALDALLAARPAAHAAAAEVPRRLNALAANPAAAPDVGDDWLGRQRRVLLERCGLADRGDIADAIRHGTYATLVHALEDARPERVIEEVRAAGLAGRGGAYFQTAVKWAACREAKGAPKYLVVNGEEGEPGIFKDRHLMEGDPHRLLEATLLAAYAAGATRAILYIHGEADLSAERLRVAVAQAGEWGLLGERILGSDFSLDVELRRGAGGFVLGEETALLESIEGYRAMPRTRSPFPVESGLWGKPTVTNNVETLCAVPSIVAEGGAWFASLGGGGGTKLFGLSGHVRRPGIVEVPLGTTLRALLDDLGGGSSTGRPIRAAVLGGPSGSVVPARQFDEPLVPRGPVNPGTGGVVALDEGVGVQDVVRTLLAFNMRESCGKCTPCREGTARLLTMLDGPIERERVSALAEVIQVASLCGLGQAAPLAVLSALAEFPDEFELPCR